MKNGSVAKAVRKVFNIYNTHYEFSVVKSCTARAADLYAAHKYRKQQEYT